jgi:hypothetical protein
MMMRTPPPLPLKLRLAREPSLLRPRLVHTATAGPQPLGSPILTDLLLKDLDTVFHWFLVSAAAAAAGDLRDTSEADVKEAIRKGEEEARRQLSTLGLWH